MPYRTAPKSWGRPVSDNSYMLRKRAGGNYLCEVSYDVARSDEQNHPGNESQLEERTYTVNKQGR